MADEIAEVPQLIASKLFLMQTCLKVSLESIYGNIFSQGATRQLKDVKLDLQSLLVCPLEEGEETVDSLSQARTNALKCLTCLLFIESYAGKRMSLDSAKEKL